jgi:ankyrin repeat protein
MKNWPRLAGALIVLSAMAVPAAAQVGGFDGEKFVKAVRERDGNTAQELIEQRHGAIIDARGASGETGLIVALKRRDDTWTGYLLKEGANPNYPAQNGDTPLITAVRVGYVQGAEWLIGSDAKVDATNRMGETPLIIAVQQRNAPLVKLLLGSGANPDKTDNAAGLSARDYAKRDSRSAEILRLIETKKNTGVGVLKL